MIRVVMMIETMIMILILILILIMVMIMITIMIMINRFSAHDELGICRTLASSVLLWPQSCFVLTKLWHHDHSLVLTKNLCPLAVSVPEYAGVTLV